MKPARFPVALSLATSLALSGAAPAFGAAAGEEWEYTISVEAEGMKMPPYPVKMCMEPEQGDIPPLESNCKLKNRSISGGTTSFHIVCGPPEPGEVKGQLTRKGDRVEGNYTFVSQGEQMKMTTVGRRLGKCDLSKEQGAAGKR